ncbi:hypothetical protein KDA23_02160 [Candidatus Saccharibacteria bacterium]|nr:hypothetical protein [Candidatus Saccharibacteria bacterium]
MSIFKFSQGELHYDLPPDGVEATDEWATAVSGELNRLGLNLDPDHLRHTATSNQDGKDVTLVADGLVAPNGEIFPFTNHQEYKRVLRRHNAGVVSFYVGSAAAVTTLVLALGSQLGSSGAELGNPAAVAADVPSHDILQGSTLSAKPTPSPKANPGPSKQPTTPGPSGLPDSPPNPTVTKTVEVPGPTVTVSPKPPKATETAPAETKPTCELVIGDASVACPKGWEQQVAGVKNSSLNNVMNNIVNSLFQTLETINAPAPTYTVSAKAASIDLRLATTAETTAPITSDTQMTDATKLLQDQQVEVGAFSYLTPSREAAFLKASNGQFDTFPGPATDGRRTVFYRTGDEGFSLVDGKTFTIPGANGTEVEAPVAQLRSNETGKSVTVIAFSLPVDTTKSQEANRHHAVQAINSEIAQLLEDDPETPVYVIGDIGEEGTAADDTYCRLTRSGAIISAAGGTNSVSEACVPPADLTSAQIYGSGKTKFTKTHTLDDVETAGVSGEAIAMTDLEFPLGTTPPQPETSDPPSPTPSTAGRIGSITVAQMNVLGAIHTAPGGKHAEMASGAQRTRWAVDFLAQNNAVLAGWQEFGPSQQAAFDRYARLHGRYPHNPAVRDQVIFDSGVFRLDESRSSHFSIPYFGGRMVQVPVAMLEFLDDNGKPTGNFVRAVVFHNPANTKENPHQQQYRTQATRIEKQQIAKLHREDPDTPIVVFGDANETNYFCTMTKSGLLVAASGGKNGPDGCQIPAVQTIDFILGTGKYIYFSDYKRHDNFLVRKTSDHPFFTATADISDGH